VELDGSPIEVDTRKAIALLAYLAATDQAHTRDALATLLWSESDQSHARAALRRTLSALNKALGNRWVEIERDSIQLVCNDDCWVDLRAFYSQIAGCVVHQPADPYTCRDCLANLASAAEIYRDDLLAGFTLRDSPGFEEWQFFEGESLRQTLGHILEKLAACYAEREEFETAIRFARRWLALDELHEPAHRYLIQLYGWSGQRSAALRQYRECIRILDQELGVSPLEETTELYEAIKENRLPAPYPTSTPAVGTSAPAPITEPVIDSATRTYKTPLVGRKPALTAMMNSYRRIGDAGHLIVIQGEAGIGKTRLAEEFLAQAQRNAALITATRSYEGETSLAYGPFVELLYSAVRNPALAGHWSALPLDWLNEGARLCPEIADILPGLPPPSPLDTPGAQTRFFEGVSQLLYAIHGASPPGILFFDDLNWADSASFDLLTYLVRRLHGHPLCILATWRGSQTGDDPRLARLLTETQKSNTCTVLALDRLSASDVSHLIKAIAETGIDIPEHISQRLYTETEGLPFFLSEYLSTIVRNLQSGEVADWSLPGTVRDVLQARLAMADETGLQLLGTASVIGRSFDFDTLREASGRGEEETINALEALLNEGLIQEVTDSAADQRLIYDFSHQKLRALVYEQTSLARRRLLHRRVAEVLAARLRGRGRREGVVDAAHRASQIAQHYQMAGQEVEAAEWFQRAGEHARTLYANTEAIRHFESALGLGHPEAAVLHEAIGDLQTFSGEYAAAVRSYETAAALSEPDKLAVIEHKLGSIHHRRGDWTQATSHFEAALVLLKENPDRGEMARLYADWSLIAHRTGAMDDALQYAQTALDIAEEVQDIRALAQAHNILGIIARNQSDLALARYHLEQSLHLAESLQDPSIRAAALNNLALAYAGENDLSQALALTREALALCASVGDRHREAALHSNLADLLHASGDHDTAVDHVKRSVAILAEIDTDTGLPQPEIWKLVEW
jgi:DNA-binding SARP family transcriptional activator